MRIWSCPFLPIDFVAYLNNMRVGDFVHVKSSVVGVVDVLVSAPVFVVAANSDNVILIVSLDDSGVGDVVHGYGA